MPTNQKNQEEKYWENAFTIFGKTREELEFMLWQEKRHWKKYLIWKTNPHNVENIKAAIKHLKKTGEERTTKQYYSFK